VTVLVTGAGGFIGSHAVEALLREGHSVRALARYNSRGTYGHLDDISVDLRARLEVRRGDVTDPFLLRDLVSNCDVVCHLAARIGIPYSVRVLCDASKAAQGLKWTPQVSLDEGLRRAPDYVRAHRDLYPAARYVI
jgi:nucleoside-diphosphate-sugar epimerase